MKRFIAHMDLDTYFVSVERLLQPSLVGKPVIVGGVAARGVVAACSYETRAKGVKSAMPMKQALQLCPEAIVLKGSYAAYSKYSQIVTDIIKESVPIFEKTSIDEFYLDLTGMDKYFGCLQLASSIRQRIISETNLPISFALSGNKTVSKIGTDEAKPNGEIYIEHGKEKEFLAPLTIHKIPMVGTKTASTLTALGLHFIKDIQAKSSDFLEQYLGNNGLVIWQKANGICHNEVVPFNERKSISSETTFQENIFDKNHLLKTLLIQSQKLGFQLRKEKKLCACIAIKVRYENFETLQFQVQMPYTAMDHSIYEKAAELFRKNAIKGRSIRLIGIRCSNLISTSYQYDLFEDKTEQLNLYAALDSIKDRFGELYITRASTLKNKNR